MSGDDSNSKIAPFANDPRRACRGEDTEMFFGETKADATAARAVCGRCMFRVDCLLWAARNGEVGVWGGTTDLERRAIRRDLVAAAGEPAHLVAA